LKEDEVNQNLTYPRRLVTVIASAMALALATVPAVAQDKPLKIGVVTFLSGAAAGPFGVPARNGAEVVTEALNGGKLPAP
jgi:branched-chain amino acid transport system substrate-binding protein